ncbi:uncharacterized protein TNCV_3268321 [Trichonephila clavipes]|nr:uncharacterized protein TNCV_3268321 [Trichonephila clavipes]
MLCFACTKIFSGIGISTDGKRSWLEPVHSPYGSIGTKPSLHGGAPSPPENFTGLATELLICCEFCGLIQPLLNTRFTNTVVNKKDTKVYEVNTRLAYAMRSVVKGEAAAKVFCGVMNLPPPPKRFYESLHALNNATEKVAKVSMALAAAETLSFNNGNPNVPVAIDGTWQKGPYFSQWCCYGS